MLYEQGGVVHFFVLALFELSPPNLLKGVSKGSCVAAADLTELRSKVSEGLCFQSDPFYSVPNVTDH